MSVDYLSHLFVSISILVDGKRMPIYAHGGRHYVEGAPGKHCTIQVSNTSSGRVEVIESVDGRDVLIDQAASLHNSGMIVRPFDSWQNKGYRLDDDRVTEFVFGDPDASIAAQATGSTSNVGVIGVAIYAEKPKPYTATFTSTSQDPRPWQSDRSNWHVKSRVELSNLQGSGRSSSASGQSLGDTHLGNATSDYAVAGAAPDLGMGMGDTITDRIGHTSFERASQSPAAVFEIHYRSRDWLLSQGIIRDEQHFPSAFPGSATGYERYTK